MQPLDWTAIHDRRRAEREQPAAMCARVFALADAIRAAYRAEYDVDLPTNHPKWDGLCEALGTADFYDLERRVRTFAEAWQAEIDATPVEEADA